MTPSVFTDFERSTTVNAFSKVFMKQIGDAISSGKVSQAWKRDDGSNRGSCFTTDYSKIMNNQYDDEKDLLAIDAKDYSAERSMIQPLLISLIWGMSYVMLGHHFVFITIWKVVSI